MLNKLGLVHIDTSKKERFDESTSVRSEVYYARRRGDSGYRGGGLAICGKTQDYDCRPATKFGPEYERAVQKHGSERKAEAKLADRQERVEKLNIRDLDPMERERFSKQWESVHSRFVDSPKGAVTDANDLVSSLTENPRLSRIRFRSTCRRYFCRPSPSGGELPVGA